MKLTVTRLGHKGDAICETENGPIYAGPFLPGEEIEGTLSGDRLIDVRIVTPSAERVKPPCQHAKTCGGCLLQHASDEFVARWKEGIVAQALIGQGLTAERLGGTEMRSIATSPRQSRRRAALSGRRTKAGALLGFHARASDMVVAVPNCLLLEPAVMAAFPALDALARHGASRKSEMTLTITSSLNGPDIAVTDGKEADANTQLDLARTAESFGVARLTWNGEVVAQREPPLQQMGPAKVAPPPGAFLQATAHGEATLLAHVQEAVGNAARIADLFSGAGTFTLPLAQKAEVRAYEGESAMIAALDRGWREASGLKRVQSETRDLFRRPVEAEELKGIDAVVIDPPRAGAEAQTRALVRAKVPVIAAVSCNPVTFARDARILIEGGYQLDWLRPVDQFRWSAHVELVARFSLTKA